MRFFQDGLPLTLDTLIYTMALGGTNLPPEKESWNALSTLLLKSVYGGKIAIELYQRLLATQWFQDGFLVFVQQGGTSCRFFFLEIILHLDRRLVRSTASGFARVAYSLSDAPYKLSVNAPPSSNSNTIVWLGRWALPPSLLLDQNSFTCREECDCFQGRILYFQLIHQHVFLY